ncbi:4641_t:CDS:2, partial [Diversispora eburnea]
MTSTKSAEKGSQFEARTFNELQLMNLCVTRTRVSCGDNGVDIFGPYRGHILLVQCKNYTAKIGKDDIRAFEGVLSRGDSEEIRGRRKRRYVGAVVSKIGRQGEGDKKLIR